LRFGLVGGDWLKFSDVLIAAVFLFVVTLLLDPILFVLFSSLNNSYMIIVAGIISALITSIITGYVFAMQIREESRLRAVGSIIILAAAGTLIFAVGWFAIPLVNPAMVDLMQSMFSTSGWTNFDWLAYTAFTMFLFVTLTSVFAFVGLFVGSMLKPKKT
jgi:hypothetical protein